MADEPRSLKTFGVAGSLRADCTVFYTSDYRSRNIGRFSDLMSAKLREVDADELRIRALLLFSLYESYAAVGKTFRSMVEAPPVSLEIGFDREQVAIGVSFHWREGKPPIISGIAQRVPNGVYQTPFEEVLGFLRQHCSKLVVKYEEKERRIEILTLLDRNDADRRDPMEVVEVDSATAQYVEAREYVEMGDLDYLALTGEPTLEAPLAVSGDENIVDNTMPEEEEVTRFSGDGSSSDSESILVSGGSSDEELEEVHRVRSGYEDRIRELEKRIQELEAEKTFYLPSTDRETFDTTLQKITSIEPASSPAKGEPGWGISFLKQMWPFGEEGSEASDTDEMGSFEKESKDRVIATSSDAAESDPEFAVFSQDHEDDSGEPDEKTLKIIDELRIMAAAKEGSSQFREVVQEITEEVDATKSKRWIDGLMGDVLMEKARLAELSRELAKQARQREMDYKAKERSMQAEFSRLTEIAKRKDTQIERNREQIAQLNMAVERAKNASASTDDQQTKLRLNTAQRIAQSKEEENRILAQKVKSLEDRLIVAQARSSRPAVDPQMMARLQASERKVEELKRVNQRLTDNLNSQRPAAGDKDSALLRRKIEGMERQAQETKKNLEKAQFRVRELQDAERKLQLDLQKTLEENRKLRSGRSTSGGEGQAA